MTSSSHSEGPPTLPDEEPSPAVPSRTESAALPKRSESGSASDGSFYRAVDFALRYAELGMHVLPLQFRGKRPHGMLGSGWSMQPGDRFIGSRDPDQIRAWWDRDEQANIGIITGVVSNLLVVDLDQVLPWPNDIDANAQLREVGFGDLPRDVVVETASGGSHIYLRLDAPCPSRISWLHKVDIKADGGYVAAPPSRASRLMSDTSPGGQSYWTHGDYRFLSQGALPDAPIALLAAVRSWSGRSGPAGQSKTPMPDLGSFIQHGFRTGQRNHDAFALACRLFRQFDGDEVTVVGVMYRVWEVTEQASDPFPWGEVEGCIRSARRTWEREADERRAEAAAARALEDKWRLSQ